MATKKDSNLLIKFVAWKYDYHKIVSKSILLLINLNKNNKIVTLHLILNLESFKIFNKTLKRDKHYSVYKTIQTT